MAPKAHTETLEVGILGRNLSRNLYRYRKQVYPHLSQQRLATLAGIPSSVSLIERIEAAQDPEVPAPNPELKTIEKLALGLQRAGVNVTASELLATPSYPTGRSRHLSVVPTTGDALPHRT